MKVLRDRVDAGHSDSEAVDATLAASGDAQAFERLYRQHVDRIHSLARRMLGVDAADEITQDVFVRAWEKLRTFRGESRFGTWLFRLAVNLILGRRAALGRDRVRMTSGDGLLLQMHDRPAVPELQIDFEAAISRLPKGAREVFVLHDVEGFKHEEIGTMLGVSAGTSKAQLHRARMTLRRHLDR